MILEDLRFPAYVEPQAGDLAHRPGVFSWASTSMRAVASGGHKLLGSGGKNFVVRSAEIEQPCATMARVRFIVEYSGDSSWFDTVHWRVTPRSDDDSYAAECTATGSEIRLLRRTQLNPGCVVLAALRDTIAVTAGAATRITRHDSVVLCKTVEPRLRNVPERSPAIAYRGGRVVIGWLQLTSEIVARLSVWRIDADDRVESTASLKLMDTIVSTTGPNQLPYAIESAGMTFYLAHVDTANNREFCVMMPEPRGWNALRSVRYDGTNGSYAPRFISNPDGTMLTGFCTPSRRGDSTVADLSWQTAGLLTHTKTALPFKRVEAVIPLAGTSRFISVGDGAISLVERNNSGAQWSVVESRRVGGDAARCLMLPDWRLLAWYNEAGPDSAFVLDVLDSNLSSLARHRIPESGIDARLVDVVHNPADSGFACVIARPDGIVLRPLDHRLRPSRADELLSASARPIGRPVGLYVRDSLMVVWEDTRAGLSDIYGLVAWAPTPASAPKESMPASGAMHVVPNPASGSVVVRLGDLSRVGARLLLVDNLGRVVTSHDLVLGASELHLSLAGIVPGIYTAVIDGAMPARARVVVW